MRQGHVAFISVMIIHCGRSSLPLGAQAPARHVLHTPSVPECKTLKVSFRPGENMLKSRFYPSGHYRSSSSSRSPRPAPPPPRPHPRLRPVPALPPLPSPRSHAVPPLPSPRSRLPRSPWPDPLLCCPDPVCSPSSVLAQITQLPLMRYALLFS